MYLSLYDYVITLSLITLFGFKSILSDISIAIASFFCIVCLEYHLPSFHFEPLCVFKAEMNLL